MANNKPKTTPEQWLEAARAELISGGIARVKIDRLARRLGVTRGGFYHFYKNREDLLAQLLKHWEQTNRFFPQDVSLTNAANARKAFDRLFVDLVQEKTFNPRYDMAVRDWARTSRTVRRVVQRVDARRLKWLTDLFEALGFEDDEAFIRARITYYQQIGYYAIGVKEPTAQRLNYQTLYERALLD